MEPRAERRDAVRVVGFHSCTFRWTCPGAAHPADRWRKPGLPVESAAMKTMTDWVKENRGKILFVLIMGTVVVFWPDLKSGVVDGWNSR
jgi:hypothetical protein